MFLTENEIDSDERIDILERAKNACIRWNLPQNEQKPCIAALLDSDIPEGTRSRTFYILATDFINRQNKEPEWVEDLLIEKNKTISKPLKQSEIKATIRSTLKKSNRTFGCNNEPLILENCIGKEKCSYYMSKYRHDSDSTPEGTHSLINKGWLPILKGSPLSTYLIICCLEKIKGVTPGRRLIASHSELSKLSGYSRQQIAEALKQLHFEGLIIYKKGAQHKWNKTASEITRVMPIPRPPINIKKGRQNEISA